MAISNRERIAKGLELMAAGPRPFVERELKLHLGDTWQSASPDTSQRGPRSRPLPRPGPSPLFDERAQEMGGGCLGRQRAGDRLAAAIEARSCPTHANGADSIRDVLNSLA
jgi:hypothetical protein